MNKFEISPDEKFLSEVRPIVEKTIVQCEKILKPKKNYHIILSPIYDPFVIKKMNGSTGITFQISKTIVISVNTSAKSWKESLTRAVSHEFNHIIRYELMKKKDPGFSIIDRIAFDGLAQCFEEDISGHKAPYSKAISESEAKILWKKIKTKMELVNLDFCNRLFFGDKSFPHWGGYTLSYLIVKKRKEELGLSWPELMRMDSKKLIGKGLD